MPFAYRDARKVKSWLALRTDTDMPALNSNGKAKLEIPENCPGVEICPLVPDALLEAEAAMARLKQSYTGPIPRTLWQIIRGEWRVISIVAGSVLGPAAVAWLLYYVPASKGELATLKGDAAMSDTLIRTELSGQLKEARAELKGDIGALNARMDGVKETTLRTQAGVDELLRRSVAPAQVVAQPASGAPAAPSPRRQRAAKRAEPQPVRWPWQ